MSKKAEVVIGVRLCERIFKDDIYTDGSLLNC